MTPVSQDISGYFMLYWQAHYPMAKLFNFLGFTATFLWCTLLFTLLNRVRAAAKITAGGMGSPYNQQLVLTAVVKRSSVE